MPVTFFELEGGPLDGRRVSAPGEIDWLDLELDGGPPVTYWPTDRTARDGTPLLEWAEPPG